MYLTLITVGKLKERYLKDAVNEYLKRLQRYHQVKIYEIEDEKDPPQDSHQAINTLLDKEGQKVLSYINDRSYVITLAIHGKEYDSLSLANHFKDLDSKGHTHITFIIGGSNGLSKSVYSRANESISFSKLTLPHQLMRVVFFEQLYRITRINNNEPYHK